MSVNILRSPYILTPLFTIFCILGFIAKSNGDVISADVSQSSPRKTTITVLLPKPPPPTVIVEMKLPPSTQISETRPKISKKNKKSNTIKWLFKNVTSGPLNIEVSTKSALDLNTSQVFIRYRDRNSGAFTELKAQKK